MTLTLITSALDYTTTPSASDDRDITGIDEVVMLYDGITQPGEWGVRLSVNGTDYPATSGDYLSSDWNSVGGFIDTANTLMTMARGTASANIAGVTYLSALQGTHVAQCSSIGWRAAGAMGMSHGRTKTADIGPFKGLRIISPSGNLTAGTLRPYKRTGVLTVIGELDYGTTPSASDDFALDGADDVGIFMEGLTPPTGEFGVRLSSDGGLSYHATSGNYIQSVAGRAVTAANANSTMFRFGAIAESNTHGMAELFGLQATYPAHMVSMNTESAGVPAVQHDRTSASVVGPFTHIRILAGANYTAGKMFICKWA